MSPQHHGFMLGYINKESNLFKSTLGGSGRLTAEALDNLKVLLIAAPPVIGAGMGMLHSKATAPSKMDTDAMQRAIELSELQEMETALRRQKEVAQKTKPRGVKNERTLRI